MGAGTLGPVYRAYDPERDRLVAVKLFTLDLPPQRVHQLVAEFQRLVAAELTHPGIAAPVAAGMVGVSAYLAQEYVSGESLDLAIREYGPAPAGDSLRVAAQLAGALDFAAVVNITHGALHPRDVLLSAEETRITGLGVARALEHVGVAVPIRRPYTAPERVSGATWDRRADIFTLAALLHELLWGRRITAIGSQAAAALTEIADADMPKLRAVFGRALSDNAEVRFSTALEFAEALKNAFPDETLVTPSARSAEASLDAAVRSGHAPTVPPPIPADELPTVPRLPLSDPEPMPPLPVHAASGDLPIAPVVDEDSDETIPMASAPAAPAPADVPELDLRAAEEARYTDVEMAPSVIPATPDSPRLDTDDTVSENDQPTIAENDQPTVPSGIIGHAQPAAERPPSRARSMALMLIVGIVLGFAGGYLVGMGMRDNGGQASPPPPAAAPAPPQPAAQPPSSGREFTEGTVAAAPTDAREVQPKDSGEERAPADTRGGRLQPDQTSGRLQADQSANPGRILVRSTPAGATVFVDGRESGRTPIAVRELARGTHHVRVVRDGYVAEERRVVITRSRPAQSMTVVLRGRQPSAPSAASVTPPATPASAGRYTGALEIESRPSSARVFVDNKLVGMTPLTVDGIRAGEHVLRIEHDGYRRWTSQVRVVASERQRITASLEK